MQTECDWHENKPCILNILENLLERENFKLRLKVSKSRFCLPETVENPTDNILSFICVDVMGFFFLVIKSFIFSVANTQCYISFRCTLQ